MPSHSIIDVALDVEIAIDSGERSFMVEQYSSPYHDTTTIPTTCLLDTWICITFSSSSLHTSSSITTAKMEFDSSVHKTVVHCLCNHLWRSCVHLSRFWRHTAVSMLPRKGRRVLYSLLRKPLPIVFAPIWLLWTPSVSRADWTAVWKRSRSDTFIGKTS